MVGFDTVVSSYAYRVLILRDERRIVKRVCSSSRLEHFSFGSSETRRLQELPRGEVTRATGRAHGVAESFPSGGVRG